MVTINQDHHHLPRSVVSEISEPDGWMRWWGGYIIAAVSRRSRQPIPPSVLLVAFLALALVALAMESVCCESSIGSSCDPNDISLLCLLASTIIRARARAPHLVLICFQLRNTSLYPRGCREGPRELSGWVEVTRVRLAPHLPV